MNKVKIVYVGMFGSEAGKLLNKMFPDLEILKNYTFSPIM